jgi:hypothetical protein
MMQIQTHGSTLQGPERAVGSFLGDVGTWHVSPHANSTHRKMLLTWIDPLRGAVSKGRTAPFGEVDCEMCGGQGCQGGEEEKLHGDGGRNGGDEDGIERRSDGGTDVNVDAREGEETR